jgi:hypothetical protein
MVYVRPVRRWHLNHSRSWASAGFQSRKQPDLKEPDHGDNNHRRKIDSAET